MAMTARGIAGGVGDNGDVWRRVEGEGAPAVAAEGVLAAFLVAQLVLGAETSFHCRP